MNEERPIEKLLRRYAKKRGDEAGAPLELHPATRRLLQGEVARQFPKPAAERNEPKAGFFALLAQRWIYAVGVFAVLGVMAVMILPSLHQSKSVDLLAKKSSVDEAVLLEPAKEFAPPAAAAPTGPEAKAQPALAYGIDSTIRRDEPRQTPASDASTVSGASLEEQTRDATRAFGLNEAATRRQATAPLAVAPASQPPARPAGPAVDSLTVAGRPTGSGTSDTAASQARQPATAAPVATTSASLDGRAQATQWVARGGGLERETDRAHYSQSFANVGADLAKLKANVTAVKTEPPITPVLANFEVQQTGNQIRVIDGDGSTYLGEINAPAAVFNGGGQAGGAFQNTGQLGTRTTPTSSLATAVTQQATQDYLWRVEGTNRTLNQNVVFTWNFLELTNGLATADLKDASRLLKQDPAKLPSQFPAAIYNSIISGRAQFGEGREIEVNAVPVTP